MTTTEINDSSSGGNDSRSRDDMEAFLLDLADDLRTHLNVKDRKYRLQTYKDVFLGREAVDYLVESGQANDRNAAIELGQELTHTHVWEHVTRDHEFGDNEYFYHFVNRGGLSKDTATGKSQRWGHFLGSVTNSSDNDKKQPRQPALPKNELLLSEQDRHVMSKVWPLDEHNRALLDNVHPPNWQNPVDASTSGSMASGDSNSNDKTSAAYDLVVIGGGTAGLITAAGSAGVGAKVALIEANLLGGDCLNVGCVPSKTLIHSANMAHEVLHDQARLERAGIRLDTSQAVIDFPAVMERVRKVRTKISHHDSAERYSKELGVDIFIGYAQFQSERTIAIEPAAPMGGSSHSDGSGSVSPPTILRFKKAAVCTGGYPVLLPIPGLAKLHEQALYPKDKTLPRPQVMTNETFFNLTERPKHMVVIGAGVIGLELAQSMQRLGVSVTVLGRSGKILPKENSDMSEVVKTQMIADGVDFRLSVAKYEKIELTGNTVESSGYPEMKLTVQEASHWEPSEIICDALLVAAGRAPNVSGLNLEAAKIKYDKKEGLEVNDYLQTTNARVYGVGDVCSQYKFTHAADFMARMVIRNALFFGKEKMSNLLIPYATFTSPEIASVGLYESDLDAQGIAYRTFEKRFEDNDRSIADDSTAGFVRFRVDAKTDRILGASIVGAQAGNLISEITLAMQSETGLGSLANVIHPYPTTAEVLRQAGDLYNRTKLTSTAKRVLRGVVKLQR